MALEHDIKYMSFISTNSSCKSLEEKKFIRLAPRTALLRSKANRCCDCDIVDTKMSVRVHVVAMFLDVISNEVLG